MANTCENILTIKGTPAEIRAFKKKAQGEDTPLSISKLHDMPKDANAYVWCMYHFDLPETLEAEMDDEGDDLSYWFWTVDIPPEKWLKQISLAFPRLRFSNIYHDMNNGKGVIHAQKGLLTEFVERVDD